MDTNEKETEAWEEEVEDFGSWLNVTDHKESYRKLLELWCVGIMVALFLYQCS